MTEHITQEKAVTLAMKHGDVVADRNGRKDFCFDDYGVHALCNAATQHYIDSQPKPVSVEADYDKVICPKCVHQFRAIPENVQTKLTQQAEALAQALAKQTLPKFIVGTDVADGVLTVTVLQREQDGITSLVHHKEIALLAI